tara:strand:+ start:179 stop:385 length:207 start_codon:yes stop_codon:yes gene_type:complete
MTWTIDTNNQIKATDIEGVDVEGNTVSIPNLPEHWCNEAALNLAKAKGIVGLVDVTHKCTTQLTTYTD